MGNDHGLKPLRLPSRHPTYWITYCSLKARPVNLATDFRRTKITSPRLPTVVATRTGGTVPAFANERNRHAFADRSRDRRDLPRTERIFPSTGQRSPGIETRSKRRLLTCWPHCPRGNLVKVTNRSAFSVPPLVHSMPNRGPFCRN